MNSADEAEPLYSQDIGRGNVRHGRTRITEQRDSTRSVALAAVLGDNPAISFIQGEISLFHRQSGLVLNFKHKIVFLRSSVVTIKHQVSSWLKYGHETWSFKSPRQSCQLQYFKFKPTFGV